MSLEIVSPGLDNHGNIVTRNWSVIGARKVPGERDSLLTVLFTSLDIETPGEVLRLVKPKGRVVDVIDRVPHDSLGYAGPLMSDRFSFPMFIPDIEEWKNSRVHSDADYSYMRVYAERYRETFEAMRKLRQAMQDRNSLPNFGIEVVNIDETMIGTPSLVSLEWTPSFPKPNAVELSTY